MLTIFTCPKPFDDAHIRMIQRNALIGWRHLRPEPEIILVGDDAGTAETAAELKLRHIPEVARNEYGTPLLPSVFGEAERAAAFPVMAYVNCDILLFQDFMEAVDAVCRKYPVRQEVAPGRRFLMIGQRTDLDMDDEPALSGADISAVDYSAWAERVRAKARTAGVLLEPSGIDYYVYPKGLWREMPPFAMGRFHWDDWLVWSALSSGAVGVNATGAALVIHQNHHYRHAADRDKEGVWRGVEAERNRRLAAGGHMIITDCPRRIARRGRIVSARDGETLDRRMWVMQKLHPELSRRLRSWKARRLAVRLFPSLARVRPDSPRVLSPHWP